MKASRFNKLQKRRGRKVITYKKVGKYSKRKGISRFGKPKKTASKSRIILKRILLVVFVLGFLSVIIGGITGLTVVAQYTKEVPTEEAIFAKFSEQWTNSKIYDRNGQLLFEARDPDKTREWVNIEEIPPELKWMVIVTEDETFYEHKGFDYLALGKAAWCYGSREILNNGSGQSCAGGSTMTQQLMKNWFTEGERELSRKVKEAIITLRTEQILSKDEVLEAYVNITNYGGTVYGLKTGAKAMFDKDLDELTLAEMAVLARVPQSPGTYSVPFASDPDAARESVNWQKNNYVLEQFEKHLEDVNAEIENEEDKITLEDIEAAKSEEVIYKRGDIEDMKAPHFVNHILNDILPNEPFEFASSEINGGGYNIYTTLDLDIQEIAEEEIKKGVENNIASGSNQNNAAMAVVNPNTGELIAYVGSKDFYGEKSGCVTEAGIERCQFDPQVDILQSKNAAGSSLKPLVSLTGFEQGTLYPSAFLPDIPITIGDYKPTNYDGKYWGAMDLRYALLYSRNVPYIQAVLTTGVDSFLDKMEQFDYTVPGQRSDYGPAVALGAVDITLLDHTYGYAVIANEGVKMPKASILKIEDSQGNVIYEYEKPEGERVADERAVYLLSNILGDRNYLNFNYRLKFINEGFWAGKTGTSDFHKDTYFMGYSPEVTVGIWAGNNDNSDGSNSASGTTTAMPIWNSFMLRIADRYPKTQLNRPAGIVERTVCKDSGLLADESTPCEKKVEVFIADRLPPKDDSHQSLWVCKDEKDKLAREIDKQTGNAEKVNYSYLKPLKEEWQSFVDKALGQSPPPDSPCTKSRNPNGNNSPWAVFSKPTNGQVITGNTVKVNLEGYSSANVVRIDVFFDGELVGTTESSSFDKTITIGDSYKDGNYKITAKIYDSANKQGETTQNVVLDRTEDTVDATSVVITSPKANSSVTLPVLFEAEVTPGNDNVKKVEFYAISVATGLDTALGSDSVSDDNFYSVEMSSPPIVLSGDYDLYTVVVLNNGSTITSAKLRVTVN